MLFFSVKPDEKALLTIKQTVKQIFFTFMNQSKVQIDHPENEVRTVFNPVLRALQLYTQSLTILIDI